MQLFEYDIQESTPFTGNLQTPVGPLELRLSAGAVDTANEPDVSGLSTGGAQVVRWKAAEVQVELLIREFEPDIMGNLQYDRCLGAIWRVYTGSPLDAIEASCDLLWNGHAEGGVDSGEGLTAQTWLIGDQVISIGTENDRALWWRAKKEEVMPRHLTATIDRRSAHATPNGLRVSLGPARPNDALQLHFATAWASHHDPEYCGPWCAVDRALYESKTSFRTAITG